MEKKIWNLWKNILSDVTIAGEKSVEKEILENATADTSIPIKNIEEAFAEIICRQVQRLKSLMNIW